MAHCSASAAREEPEPWERLVLGRSAKLVGGALPDILLDISTGRDHPPL